jgi:hypothetical protein
LNTLAKSEPSVRLGFLHHLMNGAGSYVGFAQLMQPNVLRHDHCWSCMVMVMKVCLLLTRACWRLLMAVLNYE